MIAPPDFDRQVLKAFPAALSLSVPGGVYELQDRSDSCGPAVAAALLTHFFQDPIGQTEVRRSMGLAGAGSCSLGNLKSFFTARGYDVEVGRTDLERAFGSVAHYQKPLLLHMTTTGGGHAVLLLGRSEDKVLVWDPARGRVCMSLPDFERAWSGFGLQVFGRHSRSS